MARSLWLDEAWVANSVQAPSLAAMFFHTDWLQVNPPLFLLLVRNTVCVVGLSNASLRGVPLAMGMLAAISMLLAARRVLSPAFAALACALLALHPAAIEYSHTLKQYSGELAASAVLLLATILYLQQPGRARFAGLVAATPSDPAAGLPDGLSAAGRRIGGVLHQWANEVPAFLGRLAGGMALLLYVVFIRPNFSPALHEFFKTVADSGFSAGLAAAGLFCIFAAVRIILALRKTNPGWREWTQLVCLLPCVLFAVSAALGWYPSSHRTRLFLLPCFMLLLVMTAEELLAHLKFRTDLAVLCLTLAIPCWAIQKEVAEHRNLPEEDIAGAVRFLQRNVGPGDLVLVHPSVREGFLLYARMFGWQMRRPRSSRIQDGRAARETRIPSPAVRPNGPSWKIWRAEFPADSPSRAWLFYTTRPTQWTYVGMKEQDAWKKFFWERGCLAGPYFAFENQAISPMDCQRLRK